MKTSDFLPPKPTRQYLAGLISGCGLGVLIGSAVSGWVPPALFGFSLITIGALIRQSDRPAVVPHS